MLFVDGATARPKFLCGEAFTLYIRLDNLEKFSLAGEY
jgi:hypothetical protein